MTEFKELSLETLAAGAAGERFDHAMTALLANASDPNTDAKVPRSVTLKVTVTPDSQREQGAIRIDIGLKTAPVRSHTQPIWLITRNGQPAAVTLDPHQEELQFSNDGPQNGDPKVANINTAAQGGSK